MTSGYMLLGRLGVDIMKLVSVSVHSYICSAIRPQSFSDLNKFCYVGRGVDE